MLENRCVEVFGFMIMHARAQIKRNHTDTHSHTFAQTPAHMCTPVEKCNRSVLVSKGVFPFYGMMLSKGTTKLSKYAMQCTLAS